MLSHRAVWFGALLSCVGCAATPETVDDEESFVDERRDEVTGVDALPVWTKIYRPSSRAPSGYQSYAVASDRWNAVYNLRRVGDAAEVTKYDAYGELRFRTAIARPIARAIASRDGVVAAGGTIAYGYRKRAAAVNVLDATTGALRFERIVPATGDVSLGGVAVDEDGNVVVVGSIVGSSEQVESGADATTGDVFVVKYDRSGGRLWARRFGGARQQAALDVVVDDAGSIYVTGEHQGTLTVGSSSFVGPSTDDPAETDAFLFKLSPGGEPVWAKAFGGPGLQRGERLAVRAGTLALGGAFLGAIDAGGGPLESRASTGRGGAAPSDVFVALFNSDGVHLRSHAITSPGSAELGGVGVDAAGNVSVGGTYVEPVRIADTELAARSAGFRGFVAQYDAAGSLRFANALGEGDHGTTSVNALHVTDSARILAVGHFTGAITLGRMTFTSSTTAPPSVFLSRLRP